MSIRMRLGQFARRVGMLGTPTYANGEQVWLVHQFDTGELKAGQYRAWVEGYEPLMRVYTVNACTRELAYITRNQKFPEDDLSREKRPGYLVLDPGLDQKPNYVWRIPVEPWWKQSEDLARLWREGEQQ